MIIVKCPNCGKEHALYPEEIEKLLHSGKVLITSCECGEMYTVEQGDDCFFTK